MGWMRFRMTGAGMVAAMAGLIALLDASWAAAQNYAQRAAQARSLAPSAAPQYRYAAAPAARSRSALPPHLRTQTVLPGVAVASTATPGATGLYPGNPRPVAASASVTGIRQAVTAFYLDMGRLPTPAEGLNALLRAPEGARNWRGPYVTVPSGRPPFTDPWGNPYQLIDTSRGGVVSFIIRSNGPDGLPNTADDLTISG